MKLTMRHQRTNELCRRLTAKIQSCRLSGVDPYDHPEVRAIVTELGDDMPMAAKPLQDRQEQIEIELLRIVEGWPHGGDVLTHLFAMIQKVNEDGVDAIPSITQDSAAQRLLREFAEINEQIIEMLSKED